MKKRKKIVWYVMVSMLVFAGLLLGTTVFLYEKIFDRRFEAGEILRLSVSDFPELTARPVTFQSGEDLLRGNFYTSLKGGDKVDALLIFCHGFSNGSSDYLSQINYFAQNGFEVLAYDNTGCHNSTGRGVRGLPQAVINLHDVLNALTASESFAAYNKKPIVLMGHSWGGYAANAVLEAGACETVAAVVSFSAPNDSLTMLTEQGALIFGKGIYVLRPFLWTVEKIKFGRFSGYSALGGVNSTSAPVLAIHSKDDSVVGFSSSLAVQAPRFTNPNAQAVEFENRGHRAGLGDEARAYAGMLESLTTNGADKTDLSENERSQLFKDVEKMQLYHLDESLMNSVRDFILSAINKS